MIEFYLANEPFYSGITVHARIAGDAPRAIAQPVEFVEQGGNDALYAPPMMNLERDSAQRLMDELWKCGIRPSEGQGSAGQLAAVQAHLKDMRELAFRGIEVIERQSFAPDEARMVDRD